MDEKRLLLAMAERLYMDIRFVTEQSPVQIVDDDGCRAFNNLIARVRRQFSGVSVISDFTDWAPRSIKYKDALIASGQVFAVLKAIVEPPPTKAQGIPISQGTQAPITEGHTSAPPTRQSAARPAPPPAPTAAPRRPSPAAMASTSSESISLGPSLGSLSMDTPPPVERPRAMQQSSPEIEKDPFRDDPFSKPPPKRNEDGTIPFTLD